MNAFTHPELKKYIPDTTRDNYNKSLECLGKVLNYSIFYITKKLKLLNRNLNEFEDAVKNNRPFKVTLKSLDEAYDYMFCIVRCDQILEASDMIN